MPPIPKTIAAAVPLINSALPNGNEKKPVKYSTPNAGNAFDDNASAATCSDERCDKYLDTIFTFMPYIIVASTTSKGFIKLAVVFIGPLLITSNILPAKAIRIPITLLAGVSFLKNNAPMMITNMGVREFNMPASELSSSCSAIQKRNAGKRLPKAPDKNISGSLLTGIFPHAFIATGSNNNPEVTILTAAI